jgi:hypothetical protein
MGEPDYGVMSKKPKDSYFGLHCVGDCAEGNRAPLNVNIRNVEEHLRNWSQGRRIVVFARHAFQGFH